MTARPKGGLGRGLSALIPGAGVDGSPSISIEIEIARINSRPDQPRTRFDPEPLEELVQSIRSQGVLQPLLVTPRNSKFLLVAGERRFRAAKAAGLFTVPCRVMENLTDGQILEISIVENLQREDLNPIELAEGYKQLIEDMNLNQNEVGKRVGKDRATIANTIRLLKLPNLIIEMIENNKLSSGHARALLAIESDNKKVALAKQTVSKKLSVRDLEKIIRKRKTPKQPHKEDTLSVIHAQEAAKELTELLGLPVEINHSGPGGRLSVRYATIEELDQITRLLQRKV
ncbi:MAG: ParB/RepB/Spo0J family partition protein [Candidatus Electryonea clarkiae]|nr:ParB/RepB/Spo0J family partition protein [Candidatus Electryonea clarkiae]MDP8288510.1 ParB/RepB/Spo0J family partition protein [Candidatus Electryonea clarkiae]